MIALYCSLEVAVEILKLAGSFCRKYFTCNKNFEFLKKKIYIKRKEKFTFSFRIPVLIVSIVVWFCKLFYKFVYSKLDVMVRYPISTSSLLMLWKPHQSMSHFYNFFKGFGNRFWLSFDQGQIFHKQKMIELSFNFINVASIFEIKSAMLNFLQFDVTVTSEFSSSDYKIHWKNLIVQ